MFTDDHIKHLTCHCNWPWHEQVLSHDRSHQIKRILESFFPQTSGQVSVSEDSEVAIKELVVFAKFTENEVYGDAATRDEYFGKIKRELYDLHLELARQLENQENEFKERLTGKMNQVFSDIQKSS